jgi:hypothetical protein
MTPKTINSVMTCSLSQKFHFSLSTAGVRLVSIVIDGTKISLFFVNRWGTIGVYSNRWSKLPQWKEQTKA